MTKVLFVCSQNRLRSATAERVFGGRAGLDVRSAGTDHDARVPVSGDLVSWADVILGMQRAHVLQVREIDSTADVRLITEFDPGGSTGGIDDPIGLGPEVYERVFGEIRRCLEGFVASRFEQE